MNALNKIKGLTDLRPNTQTDKGCHWTAHYKDIELRSAFQPIFGLSHQRVIGYEALIRPFDPEGTPLSPSSLFERPINEKENLQLDRICRYLHLNNFSALNDPVNWLFINVSPKTIDLNNTRDSFFGKLMQKLNFPAHRVVVEIIEHASSDTQQLIDSVNYYKSLGCLTAIDDFGAGHSNFERIWALKPDIVKLDRSMVLRADNDKRIRKMLKGIVALLHEAGCMVLMEGVETEEQALIAVDSDVDFVQGYYFALPKIPHQINKEETHSDLSDLMRQYKKRSMEKQNPGQQLTRHFSLLFDETIHSLRRHKSLKESANFLMNESSVSRCYLVDIEGLQVGDILITHRLQDNSDPRFKPLQNVTNADLYHCHYLREAIEHPEKLQITKPYPSSDTGIMCVTLSKQFKVGELKLILCCDIFAEAMH
jgi:EAL domain-containing protein (putative c-di-GMP-specific phosphodiesterase class I)